MTRRFNPDPLPRLGDQAAVLAYLNNNFTKLANLIDFDSNAKGLLDISTTIANFAIPVAVSYPGPSVIIDQEIGRWYSIKLEGAAFFAAGGPASIVMGVADAGGTALRWGNLVITLNNVNYRHAVEYIFQAAASGSTTYQLVTYTSGPVGTMLCSAVYPFTMAAFDLGDRA